MKTLVRMFRLVSDHPARVVWLIVTGLVYSAFHNSFAGLIHVVTGILEDGAAPSWLPVENPRTALVVVIAAGGGLLLGKCVFQYLRRYLRSWLSQRVVVDTQKAVAAHLLTLDIGFFDRSRSGDLLSRLTNDMQMLGRTVAIFCRLVTEPLTLIGGVAVAFWLNWRLAVLSLVCAPFGAFVVRILSRKMRRAAKRAREKQADAVSVLVQFINGIRTVKTFLCEDREEERFSTEMGALFAVSMKQARARARVRPVVELVSGTGALVVFCVGGLWVLSGDLKLQDFIAFAAVLGLMYSPAKEVSAANSEAQETLPAAERVFDILDIRPEIEDAPDAVDMPLFEKSIRFENVSFAYEDGAPVLRDIDLDIPAGSRIAFVGRTGAGKSTLVDLAARFHDPQEGRILVDGRDIRTVTRASLLRNIAMVSQEPFLFHTSIRENIAYGSPDADDDAVEAAARAACIHEEILALPDGYDTVVGERGGLLSGGQRQRVCIARAILEDAPVLILDEATSALDAESESLVQEALDHLMEGRTTLVIAHRLATVRTADRIVVLEGGRISATGTHEELAAGHSAYARYWAMQAGPDADDAPPA